MKLFKLTLFCVLVLLKVLHKMCTSELPNLDPVCPSSSSTSGGPGVKKRGRDVGLCDSGVDCDENVTETEAALPQNQGGHHLPLLNCESEDKGSEEWKPPQSKRRLTEASLLLHDSQLPLQAWSQDPLFTCSQFPKREFNLTEKKNLDNSGRSFLDSQQSEEAFESLTDVEGRVTQTPDKNHPQIEDEKENSRSISFNSPTKRPSSSHLGLLPGQKWTEPKSAPTLKRPAGGRSGAGKEARFDSTWNKLSSSPLRKPQQRHRKVEEDSWAALFTQDSEGYRVIAHRGLLPRSPLRDQSNLSTAGLRSCAYKSVDEEEEEDEMLFTQDSQGNVVIKH
uniref:Tankyrase 1-binding protein C-terminal domain-containing protein n=1 Tax=Kryptolebias marmoratus TaxID=37003 RepID=A0A3Q3AB81_KRYMA